MCLVKILEKLLTSPKLVTLRAQGRLGEKPTRGEE